VQNVFFSSPQNQAIPQHEGPISILPDDVMIRIFIYVGDKNLFCLLPLVSKRWNGMINNDGFWKQRYNSCVPGWLTYQSFHLPKSKLEKLLNTTTAFYEKWISVEGKTEENERPIPKLKEDLLWKEKYFIQYSRNNPDYDQYVKTHRHVVSNQTRNLEPMKLNFSPAFSNPYKILVFGDGLETSAKRLVYDMMWGNNTSFKMTRLYPGNDGIGSGVGFEFNGIDLNVCAIYNVTNLLLQEDYIEKWIDLFRESHGLILVMDLLGETATVKDEMDILTDYGLKLRPGIPLVVFACKQELEPNITFPSARSIADQLRLSELDRPWCVRIVEVRSLDGVFEGIDWLLTSCK